MGYGVIAHEDERDNCFSKIQLVGQYTTDLSNNELKNLSETLSKWEAADIVFVYKACNFATSRLWLIAY